MRGHLCSPLKVRKYFRAVHHLTLQDPAPEDERGVKHAVLVGVVSTSQYLAEIRGQETSTHRRQMSEQVSHHKSTSRVTNFTLIVKMISRVQPVLDWINFHIQSGHECVPKVQQLNQ